MLRVAVESAVRARQTDCPMVPHVPSSAQRPLNSEGRRAPLTDRARTVAWDAGEAGEPASARQGHEWRGAGRDEGNAYLRGHRLRAKDRLDVMLRPSGEYVEATNDERGIRSVVRRLR